MVNRKLLMNGLIRAGFTLSRALFRKNVGPFNWDGRLYFPRKNWRPFIVITDNRLCVGYQFSSKLATFFAHHSHFHSRVAHFSGLHKIAAPFVGAPARPRMLNMPKSAVGLDKLLLLRYYCTFLRINLADKFTFKMHKLDIVQARTSRFAATFFSLCRHERACRHVKLGPGANRMFFTRTK